MSATISELSFTSYELKFTPLRVSTMVTTAQLGITLDIPKLFAEIPLIDYWNLSNGVLKIESGKGVRGVSWRDVMRDEKKEKSFFNQATVVVRMEVAEKYWKEINIKLFQNGGVQMTGVRSEKMAYNAIDWLIKFIQTHIPHVVGKGDLHIHKCEVQLINSDFSIGAPIRREALHSVLKDTYHLASLYESTIYQGVKTKYFFNDTKPEDSFPGICACPTRCKGNGNGSGSGQCKKVTISPFQTGQVIIQASGLPSGSMAHIEEASKFIQSVFTTHIDKVIRKQYVLPEVATEKLKESETKTKSIIPHPAPRHVFKIPSDLLDES
jgi:hypothetical protein